MKINRTKGLFAWFGTNDAEEPPKPAPVEAPEVQPKTEEPEVPEPVGRRAALFDMDEPPKIIKTEKPQQPAPEEPIAEQPAEEAPAEEPPIAQPVEKPQPAPEPIAQPVEKPQPAPEPIEKPVPSLQQQLKRTSRTVGKYISAQTGESVKPVVGWLVGTKGAYYGESLQIRNGKNKIGRSEDMDIRLLEETSVSRECEAIIFYDSKNAEFSIKEGVSDNICYVNGKACYERMILKGYEEIEFGDSEMNRFVFVPFCGEQFQWSKE